MARVMQEHRAREAGEGAGASSHRALLDSKYNGKLLKGFDEVQGRMI